MKKERKERYLSGEPKYSAELIRSVRKTEIKTLLESLAIAYKTLRSDANELQKFVHGHAVEAEIIANDENIDLRALDIPFSNTDLVVLVWDDWQEVDETSFEVLSTEFSNLWFLAADDLDIYDKKGRWALLIDHNGVVKIFTPTGQQEK